MTRTNVVTGSAGGMGAAIRSHLEERGERVIRAFVDSAPGRLEVMQRGVAERARKPLHIGPAG